MWRVVWNDHDFMRADFNTKEEAESFARSLPARCYPEVIPHPASSNREAT